MVDGYVGGTHVTSKSLDILARTATAQILDATAT